MRDIGKNIKDLRIRGEMTQEELAEKLFVTRQTVSNYENGKSRPDVDMIVRIGEILNVDANTVIYGIPAEEDRRAMHRRAILLTAAVIVLGVVFALLYHITKIYRSQTYICSPYSLMTDICLPGFWILIGWWLSEMLSLIIEFKVWNHILVRYIRTVVLVTFTIFLIFLVYDVIIQVLLDMTFNLEIPYIPIISDIHYGVFRITYQYPILYSIFGVLFRLFGFPKRKEL